MYTTHTDPHLTLLYSDPYHTLIFCHCLTVILDQVSLYIEEHRTELEAEAGKDKLQVTKVQQQQKNNIGYRVQNLLSILFGSH